ncbi:MAG TPA: mannose-6-phosphate isomerase, class I [Chitinophagaceae bacterium]|nr:mannose-6-phosphate isomerase, class I [Chitinophagaceae bacterium]
MDNSEASIYKLKGIIRNYDWGGVEFLSKLLSHSNPKHEPMAEFWLGAHDSASSILVSGNNETRLNQFIESDKEKILGKTVAKKFGRLPFLLKILDVRDMLSIQVHPAKHEAEIEFARENKEKIPLNAPHRNYKDDNHKPELMVALGDFWLLHGFKPVDKLRATLQNISELKPLLEIFEASGYDQLYKTVMEMPQESVNQLLHPLLQRILPLYEQGRLKKDDENFWAARASLTFDGQSPSDSKGSRKIDRGIFSVYFFNLLFLKAGEGIFQDAGVPHAYLEGQNVEIMANSDNVLRGGLTNKHIDVKELMKHIRFEETVPNILHPQKVGKDEKLYRTGAPDFKLSSFSLQKGMASSFESACAEIVLVIYGDVLLSTGINELKLRQGEAAFIPNHQSVKLKAISKTYVFRASVPVHSGE